VFAEGLYCIRRTGWGKTTTSGFIWRYAQLVKPYQKDKTVLTTKLNLRLYANTEPKELSDVE
jgi:hypothetical protein